MRKIICKCTSFIQFTFSLQGINNGCLMCGIRIILESDSFRGCNEPMNSNTKNRLLWYISIITHLYQSHVVYFALGMVVSGLTQPILIIFSNPILSKCLEIKKKEMDFLTVSLLCSENILIIVYTLKYKSKADQLNSFFGRFM